MRNPYLKDLSKIEFVVTYACTGRCKHCSEGEHTRRGTHIDGAVAAELVRAVAAEYGIKTVMAFGGEPLLYPEEVGRIMRAALELEIPHRQLITNGCFTSDPRKLRSTAQMLAQCGVNDLLLSVDAFHQQTLPLATVRAFAEEALSFGIPVRLSPAWLVSREDENPYNEKTREILGAFADLDVQAGQGNVVFPEGNALKYLSEYFGENPPENPYTEDPCQIKCLSVDPDGGVLGGNIYRDEIMKIIENYTP